MRRPRAALLTWEYSSSPAKDLPSRRVLSTNSPDVLAPAAQVAALRLGADDEIAIVLTFGYPARERDPLRHTPEEWSARAARKPLDELVERL